VVALAAIVAIGVASANHFILPCNGDCPDPHWALSGSLNTARQNHTATLLRNGKVLVAGGSAEYGAVLAGAELYDPATGMWSVTGSMDAPRAGHFAFMLPNGAVLVIGGDQPCCRTSITAELYDPDTGSWSPAGLRGPNVGICMATMLQSGQVFVFDAIPSIPNKTDAKLYDRHCEPGIKPPVVRCTANTRAPRCSQTARSSSTAERTTRTRLSPCPAPSCTTRLRARGR
jgi:hypothetical protein